MAGASSVDECKPCPNGATSDAGTFAVAFCNQVPYVPPPPSEWQRVSSFIIPVVSVLAGIVTYLAVGDRCFASFFPDFHSRVWHGIALFLSTAVAPFLGLCFICFRAQIVSAIEGLAAGIIARLEFMEEVRKKNIAARKKLASSIGPVEKNELGSFSNTLKEKKEEGKFSLWNRHADGEDTWFVSVDGSQTVWTLPPGGELAAQEENDVLQEEVQENAPMVAEEIPSQISFWTEEKDGDDTWYVSVDGKESAWSLPPDGIVISKNQ